MTPTPEGYMKDAKGRLVPEHLVKPAPKLIDQTVRKILGYAEALSDRIARFKGHTYDDIATTIDLLAEQYGATLGGERGNVSLTSFDGTVRVQVSVQDRITFGPELEIAKALIYRCIGKWSSGSRPEILQLVDDAFQVSQEGKVNREALLRLRRLEIDDADWHQAMRALTDSIQVIGSREYIRIHRRDDPRGKWEQVPLDLAACSFPVGAPAPQEAEAPPEETVRESEARAFETGCLRRDDTLRNLIAEVRGVLDSKEDIRDQLDLIGDILDRAEAAEAARNAPDARVTGEAA
jgi:hypothetical protein